MNTFNLRFSRVIVICTVVLSLFSCSKKSDPVNPIDPTQLINKTWVIESVDMGGMKMSTQDILTNEGAEFQMILKNDSSITYTDNMGMNLRVGKWVYQANQTQFKIYGIEAGKSDVNTLSKLTPTELWFWHMDGNDKMTMHYKLK